MGWGGDWLPASLAIGSQGTRLPSGEAGSRERAPDSAGGRVPDAPSRPPSAPPSAPPPSPAPCRCLSFSEPRAASSEGTRGSPPPPLRPVSRARPGPAARGKALRSPARRPAIAARSSCLWSHEGFPALHLWTSLSFSPRVWREPALRPERAWGPPAEKASRGPIRHGGRRRRERQEKVRLSLPLAASCAGAPARPPPGLAGRPRRSGGRLFVSASSLLPSLSPNLAGRAPPLPTSPSCRGGRETHRKCFQGPGAGPRSLSFPGLRGLAPPSLPASKSHLALCDHAGGLPRARKPRERNEPQLGGRRLYPSFRSFSPPSPLFPLKTRPRGGPCAPVLAPPGARGPGFPTGPGVVGCDPALRLTNRGGCLCLCASGTCRDGLKMLTF